MTEMRPAEAAEWQRLGIIDSRGGPAEGWRDRGLCAQTDPDAFFAESAQAWEGVRAKATCARCEVKTECLTYALIAGETWGVWGGKSNKQRQRIARPTPAAYVAGRVDEIAPPYSRSQNASRTRVQRWAEAMRLLAAGMTPAEVAETLEITRDSVYRIKARHAQQAGAA